jgi:hypothetical protein
LTHGPYDPAFFYDEDEEYVNLSDKEEAMLIMFKALGIREEVKVGIKWQAHRGMSDSTEKLVHEWRKGGSGRRY